MCNFKSRRNSPGVKLGSVCKQSSVEMKADKIFILHFPRTNLWYMVPIHKNLHERLREAVYSNSKEDKIDQRENH